MKEVNLIRRLQAGNRFALSQAMDTYTAYLSAVVWHTMGPAATAQDVEEVVSDAFLALWSHRQTLDAEKGLKPWLAAVARNKAKNRLRQMGQDLSLEENALDIPGPDDPPSDFERAEERRLVRQAVDALPSQDREIFLRHYYYAQTVQEIADLMGLNGATVKTKLRRGRMKLKQILTREGYLREA